MANTNKKPKKKTRQEVMDEKAEQVRNQYSPSAALMAGITPQIGRTDSDAPETNQKETPVEEKTKETKKPKKEESKKKEPKKEEPKKEEPKKESAKKTKTEPKSSPNKKSKLQELKAKKKQRIEDTHTRKTYLIRNDLIEKIEEVSEGVHGFKIEFINYAIEAALQEYEENDNE